MLRLGRTASTVGWLSFAGMRRALSDAWAGCRVTAGRGGYQARRPAAALAPAAEAAAVRRPAGLPVLAAGLPFPACQEG
jgi:hypothetical protein